MQTDLCPFKAYTFVMKNRYGWSMVNVYQDYKMDLHN